VITAIVLFPLLYLVIRWSRKSDENMAKGKRWILRAFLAYMAFMVFALMIAGAE